MAEKFEDLFADGVTDLTSYRMGVYRERERIIKLLEDDRWHSIAFLPITIEAGQAISEPQKIHNVYCVTCKLIALINGENK